MIETGLQITELMTNNGMSAPEMTHALKILGNGSMQQGFIRMGAFFSEEIKEASWQGLTTGRIQGCLLGAAGTVLVGGVSLYIYNKVNKRKKLEKEEHEILRVMRLCSEQSGTPNDPT